MGKLIFELILGFITVSQGIILRVQFKNSNRIAKLEQKLEDREKED